MECRISVGSSNTDMMAEIASKTRAVASHRSMRRVSSGLEGARRLQKNRFFKNAGGTENLTDVMLRILFISPREGKRQGTMWRGGAMKKIAAGVCGVLLLASLAMAKPKYQTWNGEIMDSVCAKAGSHAEMMSKEGAKDANDCSDRCVKAGAKYVLVDPSTHEV